SLWVPQAGPASDGNRPPRHCDGWQRPGPPAARPFAARCADGLLRIRERLPPASWWPGPHPSHAAQGVLVGQRVLSRPLSLSTFKGVRLSLPSSWVSATPVLASREACPSKRRGLLRLERQGRAGGDEGASVSTSGTNAWRHPAMWPAHARNCGARQSYWSTAGGNAKRGSPAHGAGPRPATACLCCSARGWE